MEMFYAYNSGHVYIYIYISWNKPIPQLQGAMVSLHLCALHVRKDLEIQAMEKHGRFTLCVFLLMCVCLVKILFYHGCLSVGFLETYLSCVFFRYGYVSRSFLCIQDMFVWGIRVYHWAILFREKIPKQTI